jgi:hypothetical protein
MKKTILIFAALLFSGSLLRAQTVDEVLNNYYKAMGGKDKLNSIQSVYMEGVSVMQNGNEITSKLWKENQKQMRREVNSAMFNFIMIMNDKEGWRTNPQNGGKFEPMTPEMVAAQQNELDLAGPLVDYASKGHKVELLGQEDVEGANCYKVKATFKSGKDATYYIDPKTWYVIQMRSKGMGMRRGGGNPDQEVTVNYSDFRKTDDGYVFPFATTVVGMGGSTNYEKIVVNKPADPKLFKPE